MPCENAYNILASFFGSGLTGRFKWGYVDEAVSVKDLEISG